MAKKSKASKDAADKVVQKICRKTRQTCSAEEMIRIVFQACAAKKHLSAMPP